MLVGMTYRHLLDALEARSYVMLRPSSIDGVGVFAIADIPKGCRTMFGPPDPPEAWVAVPRAAVESLSAHVRLLIENYCLYDDAHYFVPADGFTKMDLSLYLNHSDMPNVMSVDDGAYFEAIRDIAVGEELLVDYGVLVDASS
jgi:SET domain-containing protein